MLPPSRSLAADLGLARNTVAEAYAELVNEGWLASRQGAGTWVLNAGGRGGPPRPRGVRAAPVHNLMPGSPDVSEFPRTEWAASARRALSTAPTEALRMGDARGRPELRAALAEYLTRARGVRTSAESVVVCAGVRHAVELLARVFRGAAPDRRRGLRAVHLPRCARGTGCANGADRCRRTRRGASTSSTTWKRPRCCSRPHTTARSECRCTPNAAPRSSTGRSAPVDTSSTTTTTASSATTASRSAPCRRCARIGWCTWGRRARACRKRCDWAGWCCRTT